MSKYRSPWAIKWKRKCQVCGKLSELGIAEYTSAQWRAEYELAVEWQRRETAEAERDEALREVERLRALLEIKTEQLECVTKDRGVALREVERLRDLIESAPHEAGCHAWEVTEGAKRDEVCDCWKGEALKGAGRYRFEAVEYSGKIPDDLPEEIDEIKVCLT